MPLPCQFSISSAAWRSTSSGMAAGPAEKLKTRMWDPGSGREKGDRAKIGEKIRGTVRRKQNGRLRVCANDHYGIVAVNPPRRMAQQVRLPGQARKAAGARSGAALRAEL